MAKKTLMKVDIITLFPEIFNGFLSSSIINRAQIKGNLFVNLHQLRLYSKDKHHRVDDTPYGGGPGMIIKPEPLFDAVHAIRDVSKEKGKVIYLSPKGNLFNQDYAKSLSLEKQLIFICGRYEGIDQRVIDNLVDEEISVGDFIISGGEIACALILDATIRLIPDVVGNSESVAEESFTNGLLEYPQYTKPFDYNGLKVPEVLLSGNHKSIAYFRADSALSITKAKRPDLSGSFRKQLKEGGLQ